MMKKIGLAIILFLTPWYVMAAGHNKTDTEKAEEHAGKDAKSKEHAGKDAKSKEHAGKDAKSKEHAGKDAKVKE